MELPSGLWQEFKAVARKGSLIDLAVAVVIGGALGSVDNSLVKNILVPLVSYVTPGKGGYLAWRLGRVEVGAIQRAAKLTKPDEPVINECPYCLSMIPAKAVTCARCTSDLPPEHEGGVD